ncbi:PAS domain-containing sensor histidine kinase [Rickettsiella grylli]|uniref:histidine kinase n=1 Tax=Rickettsiella grylli TaxID=59196 RepID=A8PQ29_9COXI|nr:PAS domain-containing sensor histidine kinase [Rickettsiella grylli]EDP45652.1 sensory box sensor histidine kinase/response regulator [Rickettsiella grylli]EDP46963.1 sensory box sensor histidine kinase/response regulator [Rickettsiella grylli]
MSLLTLESIKSFLIQFAEQSEQVYWLGDPEFTYLAYVSPAYEEIWGRSREALYKDPSIWISHLYPADQKIHPILKMKQKVVEDGLKARFRENYRIIRSDGEMRWIIDRGFPVSDEMGKIIAITGVAVDVTKEKQQEEVLKKAKKQVEVANQAKTEFLENMRHDIRTPLSGIIGCAELLQSKTNDLTISEYANDLVKSSHALLDFHNNVLEGIQVATGEIPFVKKKFDLRQPLEEIINLNKSLAAEKQLILQFHYDERIPQYVMGDPVRVQRILLELLSNALTFTKKGQVTVNIALKKKESREVIVELSVSDTGMGIPKDKQEEIFIRFKRLTPSYKGIYKGLGLGLTTVKQFVDDLDGEIYVESELDHGATFTCFIPFQEPFVMGETTIEEIPLPD